jgi:hypothetical protein
MDIDDTTNAMGSIIGLGMVGLTAGLTMNLYANMMRNMSHLPKQNTLKQRPLFPTPQAAPTKKVWDKNVITTKSGKPQKQYLQVNPLTRGWFDF